MDYATIDIGEGLTVKLDLADLPLVEGRNWTAHRASRGRVYAAFRHGAGSRKIEYLHRVLSGDEADRVRFANGDPLDCRRANLLVSERKRERKTIDKGLYAEAFVTADLVKAGHEVFIPFSGHSACDLISCQGESPPVRWQVKYRGAVNGSVRLTLQSVHMRRAGAAVKPFRPQAVDGLAIYCPDTALVYYLRTDDLEPEAGCVTLNIDARPVKGAKLAKDFCDPDRVTAQWAAH